MKSVFICCLLLIFAVSCKNEDFHKKIDEPLGKDSVATAPKESLSKTVKNQAESFQINTPLKLQKIYSPLRIAGKARGTWFFEGICPVKLVDENENIMAQGKVDAKGKWTTQDFVDFEGELKFKVPKSSKGMLIFSKANPSGLPSRAEYYKVPIRFSENGNN